MTTDEKLAAILATVQTDPGNRGLARDPHDNLFTATTGDFQAACKSMADHPKPEVAVVTGFFIPTANPPAYETDGPLGTVFLYRAFKQLGLFTAFIAERDSFGAFDAALELFEDRDQRFGSPGLAARRGRLSNAYDGR